MTAYIKVFASLTFVLAAGAVMGAEENTVPVNESRIAALVRQLDHDDFALREAAVKDLTELGPSAAEAVAQAAQSESLEAATRAFTILDKWMMGGEPAQQAAARDELAKLAAGAEEASATRRAKALLTKQQSPSEQPHTTVAGRVFVPGMPIPILGVGVARVEMRAMAEVAAGARGRRMSVSISGGTKTIKVSEGNLNVEIVESEKDGIKIKVTEQVAGKDEKEAKEKVTQYAAKNLEELKEKQPEGLKVYEKYAGAMNQLKIKMGVAEAVELPRAAIPREKVELRPVDEKELKAELDLRARQLEELEAAGKNKPQIEVEAAPAKKPDAP